MEIQQTIDHVEQLYSAVTGTRPPQTTDGPHAPIPPEADPTRHVEDQLDRLAAALASIRELALMPSTRPNWTPRVCAWDDDQTLEIDVDLPGVSRDDVEVAVDDHLVVVRGQRRAPWTAARSPRCAESEAPLGAFARTIPLPAFAEHDKVTVQLRDGVLAIRVPHTKSKKSISIK